MKNTMNTRKANETVTPNTTTATESTPSPAGEHKCCCGGGGKCGCDGHGGCGCCHGKHHK